MIIYTSYLHVYCLIQLELVVLARIQTTSCLCCCSRLLLMKEPEGLGLLFFQYLQSLLAQIDSTINPRRNSQIQSLAIPELWWSKVQTPKGIFLNKRRESQKLGRNSQVCITRSKYIFLICFIEGCVIYMTLDTVFQIFSKSTVFVKCCD